MTLRKATKQKAKLRIGVAGPSGSGKTYSALLLASGMTKWKKIALIDTENGSGDLYANLGEYNVLPLTPPFTPEKYIQAIRTCESEGMEVIIIDSVTHEWDGEGGLLEVHSKMPGNSFTNWAKITPRHNTFIQAILKSSCHVITTVRTKQGYDMSQNNGKTTVTKVGLKEVQREGFEYELTANLNIDIAHMATAGKDRTGLFVGKPEFMISADTGKQLKAWCQDGVAPLPEPVEAPKPEPVTKATTPDGKTNLLALQKELKKRGATDKARALKLLNDLTPSMMPLKNFEIREPEAKSLLDRIIKEDKQKKEDAKGAAELFGDAKPKKKVKKTSSNSPSKKSK